MHHDHKAAIIISPYRNVSEILQRKNVTHVVSILGVSVKGSPAETPHIE